MSTLFKIMKRIIFSITFFVLIGIAGFIFLRTTKSVEVCSTYCEGDTVMEYVCANCNKGEGCYRRVREYCSIYDGIYCIDRKNSEYRDYYCSGGNCGYRTTGSRYCGQSVDDDGGDNPYTRGTAIDRYCIDRIGCTWSNYIDTCSGEICSRNELIEYYVSNDGVISRVYSNLFEEKKYCKNGSIHNDNLNPIVSLNIHRREWGNTDVLVKLNCNDNDESGCGRYFYRMVKAL